MTLAALPSAPMNPHDFAAWEARQANRHELIDGRVVLAERPSRAHNFIARNVMLHLSSQPARAPFMPLHDLLVQSWSGNVRRVDVAIEPGVHSVTDPLTCKPQFVILIDRLSAPFVEELERLEDVQSIASVQNVLILAQTKPRARVYGRTATGWTAVDTIGADAHVTLPGLNATLPLAAAYEGVGFNQADESA